MIKEIRLPEISENVESGEVIQVMVAVGDVIEQQQSIIEVETEKAAFEVPSPEKGKVTTVEVHEGQEIHVGDVIIKIDTDIEAKAPEKKPPEPEPAAAEQERATAHEPVEATAETAEVKKPPAEIKQVPAVEERVEHGASAILAGPLVRKLAHELGIDINKVRGSGPEGHVSTDDVKEYARSMITGIGAQPGMTAAKPLPDFSKWGEIEQQPMSRIRKKIAENLGYGWSIVPQATHYDKADITELEKFRAEYKQKVEEAGGKLTITSIILKVVASGLKTFPKFNASVDAGKAEIIYKKYVHIGVAVSTERGLLVPVVKDVDKKDILQLAVELTGLADRTREGKAAPEDMVGGNFTISNLGGIGGVNFAPIVYWPQVAILGVSRAEEKPVYVDGQIQPCSILPLSISYDHRIIDGSDAARFLKWVAERLEKPFLLAVEE